MLTGGRGRSTGPCLVCVSLNYTFLPTWLRALFLYKQSGDGAVGAAVGEPRRAGAEAQPAARPPGGGPQRSLTRTVFTAGHAHHNLHCTDVTLLPKAFFSGFEKNKQEGKNTPPPTPKEAGSVFLTVTEFSPFMPVWYFNPPSPDLLINPS